MSIAGFGRRAHKQTHENNSGGIKVFINIFYVNFMFSFSVKLEIFKLNEDIEWIKVS